MGGVEITYRTGRYHQTRYGFRDLKRPNPHHILLVSLFNGVCYGPNPEAFNEARFVRANFKYCSL